MPVDILSSKLETCAIMLWQPETLLFISENNRLRAWRVRTSGTPKFIFLMYLAQQFIRLICVFVQLTIWQHKNESTSGRTENISSARLTISNSPIWDWITSQTCKLGVCRAWVSAYTTHARNAARLCALNIHMLLSVRGTWAEHIYCRDQYDRGNNSGWVLRRRVVREIQLVGYILNIDKT